MLHGPLLAQKEKKMILLAFFGPQKPLFLFWFLKNPKTPTPLDHGVLRWLVLGWCWRCPWVLSFTSVLSSLSKILLSRTLGRMVLMVSDSAPICFSHLLLHRTEIRALYSPLPASPPDTNNYWQFILVLRCYSSTKYGCLEWLLNPNRF